MLLLAALSVLAAGCGDSNGKTDGPSLTEEYQAALQDFDAESRALRLIGVAAKQRGANDSAGAIRSLAAALKACEEIEDSSQQAAACVALAEEFQLLGVGDATRALKIARDATKNITKREEKAALITSMARLQFLIDNQVMAEYHLSQIDGLVDQIESPSERISALVAAAEVAHLMQKASEAGRFLESALDAESALKKNSERSQALLKIAAVQAKMSQHTAAMDSFAKSEKIAGNIEQPEQKANVLIDLALALADADEKKKARQVLAEAEGVAKGILDRALREDALVRIHESKKNI